jgi:cytochrome P450
MTSTSAQDSENLDFDWLQPGALGEGYLIRLQQLQRVAPVFWSAHQNAWVVTRHADIIDGLKDPRLSNHRYHLTLEHRARSMEEQDGKLLQAVQRWIFNMDGTDHTRLRGLLMRPFSKSQIDRYRDSVRNNFVVAVDKTSRLKQIDFVNDLAFPFVAQALLDIIGMAHVVRPDELSLMSRTIVAAMVAKPRDLDIKEANQVISKVTSWILREIEDRRRAPRDDLLTTFVTLSEGGDRLTESDIVRLFQVLMLAAIDTTTNTMALMISVLDKSATHRDYIRSHPDQLPAIVEELQRYVGMMNMMHRIAGSDFEWHGQQITRGDMVYFMLAAGNRDPQVYEDPNVLNFERKRKVPLMFAPGLHHCVGHFVAKMELEITLEELFRRFDRVHVLEQPVILPNYMNIGFQRLSVRLEPRL